MLFDLVPYDQPLYRPPSEADSLILQVTLGCSHNRCSFCSMYRTKRFRPRPPRQVEQEIALARRALGPDIPRIFFADGDAMCLSTRRLLELLRPINAAFPRLQRVGIYANARDILAKSDDELKTLASNKLRMVYVGLESGDEQTLSRVEKGATVEQIVKAGRRARAAGLTTSVMVLVGLAGRERSLVHARRSAEALNRMEPSFTALLTYIPTPGSPLGAEAQRGGFALPSAMESLEEIRELLRHLRCNTYFTCNHASNYLPLRGRWPGARSRLLPLLDAALAGQIPVKPELLRGL